MRSSAHWEHEVLVCLQTSAERAAWKYAKEHSLDLITILPNFVLGPVITSRVDGLSAQFMQVAQWDSPCFCQVIAFVATQEGCPLQPNLCLPCCCPSCNSAGLSAAA